MRRLLMSLAVSLLVTLNACQSSSSPATNATPQPSSGKSASTAVASPAPAGAKATPAAGTESQSSKEASAAPIKIKVGYSAITGPQSLLQVIQEAGIFAKNGLDVELVFLSSGTKATQAFLSGDPPMVLVAGSVAISSNLAGGDAVMIATPMNTLDYVLIGAKDVKKLEDLKGKSVAISRFGSQTDFVARYILRHNNLQPDKEVAVMQIGEQPQRYAALESGNVQAALIQPPFTLQARTAGYNELATMANQGLEFASTTMMTSRAFIKSKPDVVERMVKAIVEGVAYYKQPKDKELVIRALGRYFQSDDRTAMEETLRNYGQLFSKVPATTPAGIQVILDDLVKERPEAKDAKPERFVDEEYVKKLQSSGFIDALYK